MKKNVLVFAGGPYPAIQINDCLKYSMVFNPIAASSYSNHSKFVFKECIEGLPYIQDSDFLEEFVKLIIARNIEFVIPTDDTIALLLSKNQEIIPAKIVCSPYKTAELCRYKKKTYDALREYDFIPTVYENDKLREIDEYPVFIKPDDGQGSQGIKRLDSYDEFKNINRIENKVICEYLPGKEYTVDCFTDRSRSLLFCNPRRRARIMYGISARGYNVPLTDEFKRIIELINEEIEFRGYWFAQLKRDKFGKLKLLEICTRFSGTFGVSKSLGVNLPLLSLCDFAGMDTEVIVNNYDVIADKSFIDRYQLNLEYNHVYIDYDDTITCNEGSQVNPYIMAYLYQCKAKNRKIILVTRHEKSKKNTLIDDMERLAVPVQLFDEIIELSWDEEKADVIDKNNSSIFIDNSFNERKKVSNNLCVPVFDVSNIDCLFDWRM
jgi:hypothetical protein